LHVKGPSVRDLTKKTGTFRGSDDALLVSSKGVWGIARAERRYNGCGAFLFLAATPT